MLVRKLLARKPRNFTSRKPDPSSSCPRPVSVIKVVSGPTYPVGEANAGNNDHGEDKEQSHDDEDHQVGVEDKSKDRIAGPHHQGRTPPDGHPVEQIKEESAQSALSLSRDKGHSSKIVLFVGEIESEKQREEESEFEVGQGFPVEEGEHD